MKGKNLVFLIGFMGSGKTTVGRLLAEKMGTAFYDTDSLIEGKARMKIPEIFQKKGESYFRVLERKILNEIIENRSGSPAVISTGGGMPCFGDNLSLMKEGGIVVYLKVPVSDIIKRIDDADKRPVFKRQLKGDLFRNVEELLKAREPYYLSSDIIVDNSSGKTPFTVVTEILEEIKKFRR